MKKSKPKPVKEPVRVRFNTLASKVRWATLYPPMVKQ